VIVVDERGAEVLVDYGALPIRRYPHALLVERIWQLRANLTAYDGAYVALAEVLNAPLVTRDKRLAAARGHRAVIELV
jgi:predicted nucleic acid-binding protein